MPCGYPKKVKLLKNFPLLELPYHRLCPKTLYIVHCRCIHLCLLRILIYHIAGIDAEVQWFQKPPTRMPESIYFMFRPISNPKLTWKLHKVGQYIDPLNVILNGSQILHGKQDVYMVSEKCQLIWQ